MSAERSASPLALGRLSDLLFRRTEVFDTERWLVDGVLHGGDQGGIAAIFRALLTPLAWLHQIGLELYLTPFQIGLRKRYRLPVPVISIGNLNSGGTGKTPMTIFVASYLAASGKRVVILSRGHRGKGEHGGEPRIVSDTEHLLLGPDEAGDEPVLLASALPGVPVIVCRDRRKSGRLAMERFAPEVIVLDDGLQFWQLERDLDIVLLDARRPFDNGYVLPRGLLREPPSHLSRAGAVILTRSDRIHSPDTLSQIESNVRSRTRPDTPILFAAHAPVGWVSIAEPDRLLGIDGLVGRAAIVVSGIADGAEFAASVARLGVRVAAIRSFGDHHTYTDAELGRLLGCCGREVVVVTTEKDIVKLATLNSDRAIPIYALRIAMRIEGVSALQGVIDRVVGSAASG